MNTTDTAPLDSTAILALPITQADVDNAPTIGAYLSEVFSTLLNEGDAFSAKSPLGNSDWIDSIDDALGGEKLATWEQLCDAIDAALTAPAAIIEKAEKAEEHVIPLNEELRVYQYEKGAKVALRNTVQLRLVNGAHRVRTADGFDHLIANGWLAIHVRDEVAA